MSGEAEMSVAGTPVAPPSLAPLSLLPPGVVGLSSPLVARALQGAGARRPRGAKRAIPDALKDQKYFERRRRNNLAAKRSRDSRKAREDQINLRACWLDGENAVLRARVARLREEAFCLRRLLAARQAERLRLLSEAERPVPSGATPSTSE
ncbi:Hepatic leukemia factor [Amphibalanus amphitrite]|uniref:Hepatic leukemia factor n=1 Tax=Amphibalanus amphitrite TaxID=1232801 RepID=A0A6A4VLJ6_AMPAM|nr:hepatic leukemia factor-like [Amphibalanus amphitrite]KAF0290221.1 Hepatic leukemia factor [Amphibalanus amphitrite]